MGSIAIDPRASSQAARPPSWAARSSIPERSSCRTSIVFALNSLREIPSAQSQSSTFGLFAYRCLPPMAHVVRQLTAIPQPCDGSSKAQRDSESLAKTLATVFSPRSGLGRRKTHRRQVLDRPALTARRRSRHVGPGTRAGLYLIAPRSQGGVRGPAGAHGGRAGARRAPRVRARRSAPRTHPEGSAARAGKPPSSRSSPPRASPAEGRRLEEEVRRPRAAGHKQLPGAAQWVGLGELGSALMVEFLRYRLRAKCAYDARLWGPSYSQCSTRAP